MPRGRSGQSERRLIVGRMVALARKKPDFGQGRNGTEAWLDGWFAGVVTGGQPIAAIAGNGN